MPFFSGTYEPISVVICFQKGFRCRKGLHGKTKSQQKRNEPTVLLPIFSKESRCVKRFSGQIVPHRIHVWYGIFTCIWLIFMVNEGKYTIYGCNGIFISKPGWISLQPPPSGVTKQRFGRYFCFPHIWFSWRPNTHEQEKIGIANQLNCTIV